MEVFRGKRVLIYANGKPPILLNKTLKYKGVQVIGYFLKNKISIFEKSKTSLPLIKESQLNQLQQKKDIVVLIEGAIRKELEPKKNEMQQRGFVVSDLVAAQIDNSFGGIVVVKQFDNNLYYMYRLIRTYIRKAINYKNNSLQWNHTKKYDPNKKKETIVICSPTKTGDVTINNTLEKNQISYINLWHEPHKITSKELEKMRGSLKIIIGIREPIAQNTSDFFQQISKNNVINWLITGKLIKFKQNKRKTIQKYKDLLENHKNDAQMYWENYIELYYLSVKLGQEELRNYIQNIMRQYKKYLLDPLAYPFDQEKGYTIIKEGNTEVFIYQLEKLNNLVPELSEWVGVPFDKLEKSNVGEDKWIGESYKQAQKHLKITQEYFDACYNEPYVKHFYSPEDIEKFKERWRPHIREE